MSNNYEKSLIKHISQYRNFSISELNGKENIPSIWTLKSVNNHDEIYFMFLDNKSVNFAQHYKDMILSNANKSTSIEIFNIVIEDFKEEAEREFISFIHNNSFLQGKTVVINKNFNKIIYYENITEGILEHVIYGMSIIDTEKNINTESKKYYGVTLGLIGLNIAIYIFSVFVNVSLGGGIVDINSETLYRLGADVNIKMINGEYYRLIASMFLHGGIMHIGFNMYALYALGPIIERLYGRKKYLLIYFSSGLFSSFFSSLFLKGIGVGASGAIFGLLGALLAYGIRKRQNVGKEFLSNILSVIIVNAIIGLTLPNIDNFAHLGGLIMGSLVSYLLILRGNFKFKI